ncbi:MAG: sigma-70 family RNA polymerase sigma factor [Anaerolineae bacterium]
MTEERELLRGIRSLDQGALGAAFDAYYPRLYRYIYQHLRHQATAEDLAAEVFTRLLEQVAGGGGPRQHLQAWLYRVAHNLVVDHSRRRVHRDHEPLEDGQAVGRQDVEAEVAHSISWQRACEALAELTPQQRAVIILKFLEGWSNKEVARVLDTSEGAVKSLQHRGLASMRRALHAASTRQEEWV